MKMTKSQLVQIIKEEAQKFKKEMSLKNELAKIEKQLNEVHADGEMSSSKNDGVHAGQKKPVFQKKGTHLVEIQDEMMDQESVLAALKTIATACGLTGTIELGGEEGEEGEEEVDIDVVEPETGEEEEEESEEEESEEGESEEEEEEEESEQEESITSEGDMEEEGVKKEGEMEEGEMEEVKKEGEMEEGDMEEVKKEGEMEEEGTIMKEAYERKRMMELAGIKKTL